MFYDNLVNVCERNNTTPLAIRKDLEIPQPTMSAWKHQGTTPRPAMLNKIATHLNVKPEDLVEIKEPKKNAEVPAKKEPKQEVEPKKLLLDAFNNLNPRGQKIAVSRLKELNMIQRYSA